MSVCLSLVFPEHLAGTLQRGQSIESFIPGHPLESDWLSTGLSGGNPANPPASVFQPGRKSPITKTQEDCILLHGPALEAASKNVPGCLGMDFYNFFLNVKDKAYGILQDS